MPGMIAKNEPRLSDQLRLLLAFQEEFRADGHDERTARELARERLRAWVDEQLGKPPKREQREWFR